MLTTIAALRSPKASAAMSDSSLGHMLEECNREPIHIPGAIQPHGILLAIRPEDGAVVQVAGPVGAWLGREEGSLVGSELADLLGFEAAHRVSAQTADHVAEPVFLGTLDLSATPGRLDLFAHRSTGYLIVELEASEPQETPAARLLGTIRAMSSELEGAAGLAQLCQVAARRFRALTGFDRVMIYRFVENGAGCVFAEDKIEALPPFLNHHYPASDIPQQARALYTRNVIRVIPDVHYAPAPLVPHKLPGGEDLDLSDATLRSVSPVHIRYLKNMGVAASMSVSILVDGELWGLVACHHTTPRLVPFTLREATKHLGQVLSQQIKAREVAQGNRERLRLAEARENLIDALARSNSVESGLREQVGSLLRLIPADGVALHLGADIVGAGHLPKPHQIGELATWLLEAGSSGLFNTACLSAAFPPAAEFTAAASGLLAVVLSRQEPAVLMWFRAETIETINWAGNPHEPLSADARIGALNPRKSFELWKETVRGRSRSWTAAEIESARRFRDAARDLNQREQLRRLNLQLRHALSQNEELLAQKDLLMREVDHRVQNSIQLVNSMLGLQAREAGDPAVKAQFDEARRRLMAVSIVHRRLWRSEQLQSVDLGAYLRELMDGLLDSWGRGWEDHIQIDADSVLVPTNSAVILALAVIELMTNAVKYAYGGERGPIEVSVREAPSQIRIRIADRGLGMGTVAQGSGFGSRLTRLLVDQLRGEMRVEDNKPGTVVILSLPHE
jgi:two-component system, chemotaxis family, sensor kinase Cph1